ncbi:hypothetical protein FACS1894105_08790 [Clostridia bacterium]|nr:hypothetical protein FACS1894105_08790 [Clostridia bacterium]
MEFDRLFPDSKPLTWTDDNIQRNCENIKEFLRNKTAANESLRGKYWRRDFTDAEAYQKSVEVNRERLAYITGVKDKRVAYDAPELSADFDRIAPLAESDTHFVYAVKWRVFEELYGEGLLLEPKSGSTYKTDIYLPHAGVSPEAALGLEATGTDVYFTPPAHDGRLIIPALVDRSAVKRDGSPHYLTNREYVYRPAFQLGRHIIGYEVQEVLALVDWLKKTPESVVTVSGQGDGGLIALYAAAIDLRIDEAVIADYFYNRDGLCDEPIDRNVFGLLEQFGDTEIASLIAPRKLTIVDYNAPELILTADQGGTPGILRKLDSNVILAEVERTRKLVEKLNVPAWIKYQKIARKPDKIGFKILRESHSHEERVNRIVNGMDRHNLRLLDLSVLERRNFWNKLDVSSPESIADTIEWYREDFTKNHIGLWEDEYTAPNPQIRLYRKDANYTVYQVELDVYAGLSTNGTLLIPADMKEGEKRPVVVCQHGLNRGAKAHIRGDNLDGDTIFFSEICEKGFIVYAPQGVFSPAPSFRYIQRLCNPLGKSMFSVLKAQYTQTVKWLTTLDFILPDKIGYYGISYGGTTAMYLTPLIPEFSCAICSANFNYWANKCANTLLDSRESYTKNSEYEIFEFDMANTYDHSDMAKMIAPRPFLVERGHLDGVAHDETVGYEFGKVRFFYDHCLKIPENAEIKWIDGGHTAFVNEVSPFLEKHLCSG